MELSHAVILALIQGLTEFLPISSTAHLILVPYITHWPDQGLAYDVALNTATWLAVFIYFRRDILQLAKGFFKSLSQRSLADNQEGSLAWMILAATIPVGLAGLLAHKYVEHELRTIWVIGASSIVWGTVLFIADRRQGKTETAGIKWGAAILVGLMQAVALIPGTSRSGITMTFGLFAGLSRTAAARFSYLLAVVVGGLAGSMEALKLAKAGVDMQLLPIAVGFVVAFISAYLVIHLFLKLISRLSMTPFVVYRISLGIVLLAYAWG